MKGVQRNAQCKDSKGECGREGGESRNMHN